MTNIAQFEEGGKVRTFKVQIPLGYLPLVIDADGSRWLMLSGFATWLGLSLSRDIMPKLDAGPRFWKHKRIQDHVCLPIERIPEFLATLRVEPSKSAFIGWLRNHALETLRAFQPPVPMTPLLPEEVAAPALLPVASSLPSQAEGELVSMTDGGARTTTLAIAQGTENEHKSVIQLVRAYKADLEEFGPVAFQMLVVEREQLGGKQPEVAFLNEDQATLLITYMRNNEVVRAFKKRLVKAFRALVNQAQIVPFQVPKTLGEALRLAADLEEKRAELACKVQAQTETIAELGPKAAGLDRIATTDDRPKTLTEAAKLLQMPPKKFFAFLAAEGWIYRQNGTWLGYQDKVTRRFLEHKYLTINRESDDPKDVAQVLVTPKGITRLAQIVPAA
jgi:anti-repressor protein